jgi:hypothetical protein
MNARHAAWLLALLLTGCGGGPAPPGTASSLVAQEYYDAVIRKDWPAAYTTLHPDSRAKMSAEQFTRKAEAYRRQLGFEPQQAAVRSCEEHGAEATAHVVLKGDAAGRTRSFKDAIVLRQAGAGWGVMLPPRFGERQN